MQIQQLATIAASAAMLIAVSGATAQLTEGFNSGAVPASWTYKNNSNPIGTLPNGWFNGNLDVFPAHTGAGYLGANFQSGAGVSDLSSWAILPSLMLENGSEFSFWTRTIAESAFPDRLQVRMNLLDTTNVGTLSTDVGDFTTLLLDINPTLATGPSNYPEAWTQFSVTLSGIAAPTTGRIAFRYFVDNGGPFGDNSNYIGVDDVSYTVIPAPGAACLLGAGILAAGRRRRR